MSDFEKLADSLDCFWNAAIGAVRHSGDATACTVMDGMVAGFAAVAERLREHATLTAATQPTVDTSGEVEKVLAAKVEAEYHRLIGTSNQPHVVRVEYMRRALTAALKDAP